MEYFVAGCIGGGAGVLVGHPFDTVKVRMQRSPSKYTGPIQCTRMIITKETVAGLYKGLLSPLYGLAFMNAIVFGVQGNLLRLLPNKDGLLAQGVAGAVAGVAQSFICSPTELARIRMQNQGQGQTYRQIRAENKPYYKGPVDCLWKIYKTEGVRNGIFRGLTLTILREGPSFGVYFPTFHAICRHFTPGSQDYSVGVMFFAGGISGMLTWLSTYPFDVVKTRYQDDATHQYRNVRHCFVESYKVGGGRIFFRGLSVALLRAFPTNAATLTVTTVIVQRVRGEKDNTAES